MSSYLSVLERIAVALEKIAEASKLDRAEPSRINATTHLVYLRAMRENSEKLTGRMSVEEISQAIGMPVGRGDRVSVGIALTEYGALKGKSGSSRYYVFQ